MDSDQDGAAAEAARITPGTAELARLLPQLLPQLRMSARRLADGDPGLAEALVTHAMEHVLRARHGLLRSGSLAAWALTIMRRRFQARAVPLPRGRFVVLQAPRGPQPGSADLQGLPDEQALAIGDGAAGAIKDRLGRSRQLVGLAGPGAALRRQLGPRGRDGVQLRALERSLALAEIQLTRFRVIHDRLCRAGLDPAPVGVMLRLAHTRIEALASRRGAVLAAAAAATP